MHYLPANRNPSGCIIVLRRSNAALSPTTPRFDRARMGHPSRATYNLPGFAVAAHLGASKFTACQSGRLISGQTRRKMATNNLYKRPLGVRIWLSFSSADYVITACVHRRQKWSSLGRSTPYRWPTNRADRQSTRPTGVIGSNWA